MLRGDSLRFVHISDTHLGFRQYGLSERETDFYHAFDEAVGKIISERPDFVIHSGDLFDGHRPQPRALYVAQKGLSRLREKGIPVYAITGNHDVIMRRGAMPPHVLYRDLNLRLMTEDSPFYVHDGVFIGGTPYTPKYYSGQLLETMGILSGKCKKFGKSVLVLHQGLEEHLPHEFELKAGQLPDNFSYYAFGHVHGRIIRPFGKGKLAYPGSTELWSLNEFEDYKRNGKGFYLVDMHGDEPAVQAVDLELRREILKERVRGAEMGEWLDRFRELLAKMGEKPLVYLDVDSRDYDRKSLHDRLISALSATVLSVRVSYRTRASRQAARVLTRTFNVPGMIAEAVKDRRTAGLAVRLFETLADGNEEQALRAAEEFYGGVKVASDDGESGGKGPGQDVR